MQSQKQMKTDRSSKRTVTFEATAYTTNPENNGSRLYNRPALTASGYDVTNTITYEGRRIVAVDLSIVPLVTKGHVEGFGHAIALDTGGAIRGRIMDLLVGSKQEALEWGRRQVSVTFEYMNIETRRWVNSIVFFCVSKDESVFGCKTNCLGNERSIGQNRF
jgi:3D (Asp-Asp-Asp) domain-containing protein